MTVQPHSLVQRNCQVVVTKPPQVSVDNLARESEEGSAPNATGPQETHGIHQRPWPRMCQRASDIDRSIIWARVQRFGAPAARSGSGYIEQK